MIKKLKTTTANSPSFESWGFCGLLSAAPRLGFRNVGYVRSPSVPALAYGRPLCGIKKEKTTLKKIHTFILTLLLGQENSRPKNNLRPAIKNQCLNVKRIWNNKHYNDFGIERIIRLTLALSLFIFPGLYVRHIFGKMGLLGRKLGIEFYVILKLFLPIIFFKLNLTKHLFMAIISGVMAIETILYLATLIYLSNEFAKPISYRRSITTLFINYIEVCLDFAVIYSFCNLTIPNFFNHTLTTDLQSIYFSFVTSATVGYGDITTSNSLGQFLIISQIVIFLVFIALFINFFASKVQDPTYYNSKPNYNDKWQKSKKKNATK